MASLVELNRNENRVLVCRGSSDNMIGTMSSMHESDEGWQYGRNKSASPQSTTMAVLSCLELHVNNNVED